MASSARPNGAKTSKPRSSTERNRNKKPGYISQSNQSARPDGDDKTKREASTKEDELEERKADMSDLQKKETQTGQRQQDAKHKGVVQKDKQSATGNDEVLTAVGEPNKADVNLNVHQHTGDDKPSSPQRKRANTGAEQARGLPTTGKDGSMTAGGEPSKADKKTKEHQNFEDDTPNEQQDESTNTVPLLKTLITKVVIGRLDDYEIDAVVNSTNEKLDFSVGFVAKALVEKAGNGLQQEARAKHPGPMQSWEILTTGGYRLPCKHVLHGMLQPSNKPGKEHIRNLQDFALHCLEEAEYLMCKSIAFPALGTGKLGYNPSDVAKAMFGAVDDFKTKNRLSMLEEVHFVLHRADKKVIQAFVEQEKLTGYGKRSVGIQKKYKTAFTVREQRKDDQAVQQTTSPDSGATYSESQSLDANNVAVTQPKPDSQSSMDYIFNSGDKSMYHVLKPMHVPGNAEAKLDGKTETDQQKAENLAGTEDQEDSVLNSFDIVDNTEFEDKKEQDKTNTEGNEDKDANKSDQEMPVVKQAEISQAEEKPDSLFDKHSETDVPSQNNPNKKSVASKKFHFDRKFGKYMLVDGNGNRGVLPPNFQEGPGMAIDENLIKDNAENIFEILNYENGCFHYKLTPEPPVVENHGSANYVNHVNPKNAYSSIPEVTGNNNGQSAQDENNDKPKPQPLEGSMNAAGASQSLPHENQQKMPWQMPRNDRTVENLASVSKQKTLVTCVMKGNREENKSQRDPKQHIHILEDHRQNVQDEVQWLDTSLARYKQKYAQSINKVQNLDPTVKNLQEKLAEACNEIKNHVSTIDQMKKDHQVMKETHDNEVKHFQDNIKGLKTELKVARGNLTEAQAQNMDLAGRNKSLSDELDRMRQRQEEIALEDISAGRIARGA